MIEIPRLSYYTLLSQETLFQKSYEQDQNKIQKVDVKKVKNQQFLNGCTGFMETIIESLSFLNRYTNQHAKFEIDRTIVNVYINEKSYPLWTD